MKYFLGFSFGAITLVIGIAIFQYLFCPQFEFKTSSKFSGSNWFNPYAGTSSSNWVKCNFHAHTAAWSGVTCGKGSARDVESKYRELNYGVHCVSDYQNINKELSLDSNYVPVYEHGYNLLKTHQLVIGAATVSWADFILPQTLSNKQWVLNHLSQSSNEVVALSHPEVRNAYSPADMQFLKGFQCIEVLNPSANSFSVWDAALSSGKPLFIMGDDDVHNVLDGWDTGRFCTCLNLATISKQSVIEALKSGRGYGMEIGFLKDEDTCKRRKRIRETIPYLKSCELQHENLMVEFSKPALQIEFIGQDGRIIETKNNYGCKANYFIHPNDRYVRIAAIFNDSAKIYLNPVFRYSSQPFQSPGGFMINKSKTLLLRSLGIVLMMTWVGIVARFYSKRRVPTNSELDELVSEEPVLLNL